MKIKEFLVGVRAAVNNRSFNNAQRRVSSLAGSFKRMLGPAILAVGVAGVVATAKLLSGLSKVNTETVATDNALKAMGKTIEEINENAELKISFEALKKEAEAFALPENFSEAFQTVRDIQFEFMRLRQIASYAMQWIGFHVAKHIEQPLRKIKDQLKGTNDTLGKSMQNWAKGIGQAIGQVMRLILTLIRAGMDIYRFFKRLFDMIPDGFKKIGAAAAALGLVLMAGPLGIIIGIITVILLLLDDFYTYLDGGEAALGPVWDKLLQILDTARDLLGRVIDRVNELFQTLRNNDALNRIGNAFRDLGDLVVRALMGIGEWISNVKAKLDEQQALQRLWEAIRGVGESVGTVIGLFAALVGWVLDFIVAVLGSKAAQAIFRTIGRIIETVVIVAVETLTGALNGAKAIIDGIAGAFEKAGEWATKAGEKAKAAWGNFKGFLGIGGGGAKHSQGGVFYARHQAEVAEDGPEAVIPLSKPNRARAVLSQIGGALGKMKDSYDSYNRPLSPSVTNNSQNVTVNNTNNNNIYGGSDPNATAAAVNNTNNAMLIRSLQGVVA